MATPALLTRMSTPGCCAKTWAGKAATAARSATSSRCWLMRKLGAATISMVRASSASLTSARARWQPRRASDLAMPLPMPLAAPVTTAVRLRRFIMPGIAPRCGSRCMCPVFEARELHGAVVHGGEAERQHVQGVVLIQPPRFLGALFREDFAGALDIAGTEFDRGFFGDGRIPSARRAVGETAVVHMVQQPANILGGQIGF